MKYFVISILFFLGMLRAAPSITVNRLLDTTSIHKIYVDGDFDQATDMLETALRDGTKLGHRDSVFAFKHLGVMYAAKYETREKGKKYMMLLLQTEPTAKIMDMYASDMIYMIFKNLQDEYSLSLAKMKRAQGHVLANAETEPPKADSTRERPRSFAWVYWTAGALVATGGIVLAVHLASEPDVTTRERIVK
jgi:hypothetical protein